MKKTIPFLLSLLMICMLAGCTPEEKGETPPEFITAFQADITGNIRNVTVEGKLKKMESGEFSLEIKAPSGIKGMIFEWDGSKANVSYRNMKVEYEMQGFPQTAMISALGKIFQICGQQQKTDVQKGEDGHWIYAGETGFGAYTFVQDWNTGALKSISIPDMECVFIFQNVEEIKL